MGVAQLVERQTVDLDVAGSNPVTHPMTFQPYGLASNGMNIGRDPDITRYPMRPVTLNNWR